MLRRYTADAVQQALNFLVSQVSHIEAEVIQTVYPDIQYPQLIPVDTSAPEWAKSVTFFSMEKVGRAEWFNHLASDMALADVQRTKFEHGIEMAGIGYRYSLEELGQAQMVPGMNLTTERADAARRAYEEFVDEKAITGDTNKGWTGLVNDANVTVSQTAANGTGNSTAWADKDADKIIADVNDALTGVFNESRTVEMADTVLLPVESYTLLANKRLGDTTMTALQFLMLYNVFTAQTGQPLMVRAVRGLETAGEGSVGRMVVYRRDPRVVKLHLPMPHRFLPVWQTSPIMFDVPGIFRMGGVEIRRPGAVRYVDGVQDAPYE